MEKHRSTALIYVAAKLGIPEAALKYSGLATQFYIIGDCSENYGNIQKSIHNAFFMASQV